VAILLEADLQQRALTGKELNETAEDLIAQAMAQSTSVEAGRAD